MIIESENGMENRILPDTSVVMAFRLKGHTAYTTDGPDNILPAAAISGLRKTSRLVTYATSSATLLVIFHEGGAAAFFRQPLYELYDQSIPLDCLIPAQQLDEVEDRLAATKTDRQKIAVAEQFLLSRLKIAAVDPLITCSIQQIKAANGAARIKDMISGLHISRDPFEKRFRKVTGTSPKQFATIIRLRHVIATVPQARNFTDAAYNAGYFDQAHFIKDFRLFTGQAPHDFFSSVNWW